VKRGEDGLMVKIAVPTGRKAALVLAGGLVLGPGACALPRILMLEGVPGPYGSAPRGQPDIPFSGARVDRENQAVLDALTRRLAARPYHVLSPQQARNQPAFSDGVQEVLRQQGRPLVPLPGVLTRDIGVQGGAGLIPARVYAPVGAAGGLPVIVYFHGGGWVVANPTVYDASARALVRETGAIVVSVDYRKAPEHRFPAQHEDALAAYRWVLANAASLGGDPARVALAGESAGGNLALATAVAARDSGLQQPVHVLSVYPIAGTDLNTPSYQQNANALPLDRATMAWFLQNVVRTPADLADPRINLLAADLRGLPPVTLIQAEVDPLRSEGELLARGLRAARVDVEVRGWEGATHEFFGADAVIPDAGEAQRFAGQRLRAGLAGRR
jgi:acetyl esterase/lipase